MKKWFVKYEEIIILGIIVVSVFFILFGV